MLISDPPVDDAVRALYDEARAEDGYVMNLARAWAWRTDVHAAFTQARRLIPAGSNLSAREIAVLNAATASARRDAYCSLAWGARVAALAGTGTAAALLKDEPAPALSARETALARWARAAVHDPNALGATDVDALRSAGLSDADIVDATLLVAFRLAFTTVNAALGAEPDAELAAEAPADVRAAVTYGRPVAGARA